ncbi:MAG: orotidine-5'-phosphate decarboxylase [Candidatus Micrarchaeia archaeon]
MDARGFLVKSASERGTVLCFGVDPDMVRISNISTGVTVEGAVGPFFHEIIDRLLEENAISAIKPNYAYFAQYGFDGLFVLEDLIQRYKNAVPVILDGKRGDIGKTSEAYAREAYDFWGAHAVTVSPYMGYDSVAPFLREGRLAYALCRTSNKGAEDFQEMRCGRKSLYEHVAVKAAGWGCGLVVGSTSDAIRKIVRATKGESPLLIPGIGSQGGDLGMVMDALGADPMAHRINASSSISYSFEKRGGRPAEAALKEASSLNSVIRKSLRG